MQQVAMRNLSLWRVLNIPDTGLGAAILRGHAECASSLLSQRGRHVAVVEYADPEDVGVNGYASDKG
jgi:hypothetical protein